MDQIRQYLLLLHIITGGIALLTGPVAMMNQNGNKTHRLTGKLFFYAMTIVFITSIFLSIYDDIPFLLMIGVFSYNSIALGYRALYLKKLNAGQKAQPIDWFISITTILFNIGLISWGFYYVFIVKTSFGIIGLLFGSFGLLTNVKAIQRYRNGYKVKNIIDTPTH